MYCPSVNTCRASMLCLIVSFIVSIRMICCSVHCKNVNNYACLSLYNARYQTTLFMLLLLCTSQQHEQFYTLSQAINNCTWFLIVYITNCTYSFYWKPSWPSVNSYTCLYCCVNYKMWTVINAFFTNCKQP